MDKLVKEDILPNFKGFEYHKGIMFKTPVEAILAGFYFEKIKDHVYLWQFFQPVFIPSKNIYFTFGERLGENQKRYRLDADNIKHTMEIFNREISSRIAFVEELESVSKFYSYFLKLNNNFNTFQDLALTSCYLDDLNCLVQLQELINRIESSSNQNTDWMQELLKRTKLLLSISKEERKLLYEEWRNYTLKELGLSKWSK